MLRTPKKQVENPSFKNKSNINSINQLPRKNTINSFVSQSSSNNQHIDMRNSEKFEANMYGTQKQYRFVDELKKSVFLNSKTNREEFMKTQQMKNNNKKYQTQNLLNRFKKKVADDSDFKHQQLQKSIQHDYSYNPEDGTFNRNKTLTTYGQDQILQMVTRFQNYQITKKKKLQRLKDTVQEMRKSQMQEKPNLNAKTLQIMQQLKNEPLYVRYEKQLQKKKKNLQEQIEKKRKKEQQQQQKIKEEYAKIHILPQKIRSYDDFFEQMVRWNKNKEQKYKQKKQAKQKSEVQGLTFKPKINNLSKKMKSQLEIKPLHIVNYAKNAPSLQQFIFKKPIIKPN